MNSIDYRINFGPKKITTIALQRDVLLKVFPYAFNDTFLSFEMQLSPKQALMRINHVANMVKQVNGTLISIFHNDCLSNFDEWKYWEDFYEDVLKCVKDS